MKNKIEAVFIDRDGTIGGNDNVTYPKDFELYPFTKKAINLLKNAGLKIFAFTNQPGISKGECTLDEFEKELLGYGFDGVYICPHSREENCLCRKPKTGMLDKAQKDYNLNLHNCVIIGDRWSDMLAGYMAGTVNILVKTGAGCDSLCKYRDKWIDVEPDYIAENLLDAVQWILSI